jgi:hypothetical protein
MTPASHPRGERGSKERMKEKRKKKERKNDMVYEKRSILILGLKIDRIKGGVGGGGVWQCGVGVLRSE